MMMIPYKLLMGVERWLIGVLRVGLLLLIKILVWLVSQFKVIKHNWNRTEFSPINKKKYNKISQLKRRIKEKEYQTILLIVV